MDIAGTFGATTPQRLMMNLGIARVREALAADYRIDREVGRGGMAVVYLAEDLKHKRRVAIKVMRPELTAAIATRRFLREVEMASRLQHPHIVPVYDSGERSGVLFFVMPWVDDQSLRDRMMRQGQLPLADAVRITRQVGLALDYAHSHGVVHRDVKPENILLADGVALVADFGLARAVQQAGLPRLTETGIVVGTPVYMSPEQGSPGVIVDGRADQYSVACMIYEMLVGRPPFDGADPAVVLARHLVDPVPSIRAARPAIPAQADAATARAMAKTPGDRFATVTEFADALEMDVPPDSRPSRRERWPSWVMSKLRRT
jgi:eukaryotic-like serine/threonine-protein kinase